MDNFVSHLFDHWIEDLSEKDSKPRPKEEPKVISKEEGKRLLCKGYDWTREA